jgi:hypothetical protein
MKRSAKKKAVKEKLNDGRFRVAEMVTITAQLLERKCVG